MDKRIRELDLLDSLLLNDLLPMDRTGLPAAKKFSIQQLVDLVNNNVVKQEVYTGATNPDNALGNDGDTYYKYVAGISFGIWYKASGAWGELFTITLASNGAVKIPVSAGSLAINWQTAYPTGYTDTYADLLGNKGLSVYGNGFDGSVYGNYNPTLSYTMTGALIDTVTISDLQDGFIIIT